MPAGQVFHVTDTFTRPERAKLAAKLFGRKSKSTPKAPRNVEPVADTPFDQLPEDLRQKVGAVEALGLTIRLLRVGLFQGATAEQVQQTLGFQSAVLENATRDLHAHPDFATHFPNRQPATAA